MRNSPSKESERSMRNMIAVTTSPYFYYTSPVGPTPMNIFRDKQVFPNNFIVKNEELDNYIASFKKQTEANNEEIEQCHFFVNPDFL